MDKKIPKNENKKITDIYLEEDTLTLWRPPETRYQYKLVPDPIPQGADWSGFLQTYYTRFDCVTSILTFDGIVPIIAKQRTTLKPTDDYSILRDYPRIQGLWFRPVIEDELGPNNDSTLGNVKLSISLHKSEKESIFTKMNVYFLEVLDYPAEDKSVSRLLLTRWNHDDEFNMYNIFKPGGPIYVIRNVGPLQGDVEVYYLRTSTNYPGQRWRHEVEFMLEEDPWPMCKITPVNHSCFVRPTITATRDLDDLGMATRYRGASWEQTLAGLFVWALRAEFAWLVFERLHEKVKIALDSVVEHIPEERILVKSIPNVCSKMFRALDIVTPVIMRCQNERDLRELQTIFLSVHTCHCNCHQTAIKNQNSAKIFPLVLLLLERILSANSPKLRKEMTSTMLPWSIIAYYCSSQKIRSYKKMILFVSQIEGIRQTLVKRPDLRLFLDGSMNLSGISTPQSSPSPDEGNFSMPNNAYCDGNTEEDTSSQSSGHNEQARNGLLESGFVSSE